MTAPPGTAQEGSPEPGATGSNPLLEIVSKLVADIAARVSSELEAAEQSTAPRLREAVNVLRESIRGETFERLRLEFEGRFRESMEIAKREFAEKIVATSKLQDGRTDFEQEVATARKRAAEISAELIGKQSELDYLNRETASMLEDPEVELSKIIRHNTQASELRAYIKGLQYQSGELPKDPQ